MAEKWEHIACARLGRHSTLDFHTHYVECEIGNMWHALVKAHWTFIHTGQSVSETREHVPCARQSALDIDTH